MAPSVETIQAAVMKQEVVDNQRVFFSPVEDILIFVVSVIETANRSYEKTLKEK